MQTRLFLIILAAVFLAQAQAGAYSLTGVQIEKHKYYDNLYFYTSDYVRPKVELLDDPPRLVVDFKGGDFSSSFKTSAIKSTRIKALRTGNPSENVSRVVIDLARSVDFEVASIIGKNQVQVEIREKPGVKPSDTSLSSKPVPKPKPVPVPDPVPASGLLTALDSKPAPAKTVPAPRAEKQPASGKSGLLRGKVIVIDPGHGGGDPGAIANGLVEKDMNLKTALQLSGFLKSAGAKVYLTRTSDVKVNLKDVAAFANRVGADAFVSIHFNFIENASKKGTETYYYSSQSQRLANAVHAGMLKGIHRDDRGVRKAKFYVIHHTSMPAILVEPLYISNRSDADFAKSGDFYKRTAWDITAGLKEYFK
ncbi:MAG: N-acetylmuramoyl-L-alanine amidase [Candidatus Margulisbacteria bacterium]|nr:N-acetylmuramoyl-L-alanine amidase [Candidatus Margulisiibacteriota bacterium]